MNLPQQIAKHLKELHFGGNWTCSSLQEHLSDVTWQEATKKVYSLNTIATLTFHMNYFVSAILRVLQNKPINASDKLSFDHPPINSPEDWKLMLDKTWKDAQDFIDLVDKIPESKMEEIFVEEKYGIYYRNLHGIIEHSHYHLGQIVIIKKLIREDTTTQNATSIH